MRIVLLGATGFVGHHLLPKLSDAGHDCLVLCRYPPGCRELTVIPRVEVRRANIFDAGQLAQFFDGVDAVINMVGILNESGRNGKGFHRAHVELVEMIIAAARKTGVRRLLQVSALHAGKGSSHYLISKGKAEELIRAADGLDATIFQPSVIFGDGDSFFNRFAALLKLAPVLPLACPDAKMQPVWVGDLTAMMTLALENRETFGETLVAVGPQIFSLRELVEYAASAAGLRRKIIGLPDGLSRLQGAVMDFVPGKPFSSDNYRSLQTDNTSAENSLPRFGITPRALQTVVPEYLSESAHQHHLDDYRKRAGR
ncbi:MAG: complex I NDUFA9 subunit family protein [Xanthomonadales bacterium]|nr:complex I NDUFA9 subunit family protein [Gammaproteobacteria bacterium]MBT8052848.1 complex I NDUFA9 subunit family protein [Gammaproteobacteria bacterium]NND55691.1 complex I NDUFA9 subunit family protein [Xanthomonadales bacterium]NNK50002.1 complex I NDUFA9 subunit family protein [Xanthomonadales bacterium]